MRNPGTQARTGPGPSDHDVRIADHPPGRATRRPIPA